MEHQLSLNKEIKTKADFEVFLKAFVSEVEQDENGWENTNLTDFLNGMDGFVRDMEGYYKNMNEPFDINSVNWKILADILSASTVYE